jgi:hypothetical protein
MRSEGYIMKSFVRLLCGSCVLCAAVFIVHGNASAATCSVTSSGFSISSYNVFTATSQTVAEASGAVAVNCTGLSTTASTTVTVGVSGINNGTYQNPSITQNGFSLSYTLTFPGNSALTWNLTNVFSQSVTGKGQNGTGSFNIPAFTLVVPAKQDIGVSTAYTGSVYFYVSCTGASVC